MIFRNLKELPLWKKLITALFAAVLCLQLGGALYYLNHIEIRGDSTFAYTLANNPYSYQFFGMTIGQLPGENGWFDDNFLRQSFIVEPDNRFNFSQVYYHQRRDYHPFGHYMLVNMICSIFAGSFSPMYSLILNFLFLIGTDVAFILLAEKLWGSRLKALVPICCSMFLCSFQNIVSFARMYMMMDFLIVLFLYFSIVFYQEETIKRTDCFGLFFTVLAGCLTHYSFYLYCGLFSVFLILFMLRERKVLNIRKYIETGLIAVLLSFVIYPWSIRHVLLNDNNIENIHSREITLESIQSFVGFLNQQLLNSRIIYVLIILALVFIPALIINSKNKSGLLKLETNNLPIMISVTSSSLIYSIVVLKMSGNHPNYLSPVYLPFALILSSFVLFIVGKMNLIEGKADAVIAAAIIIIMINPFPVIKTISDNNKSYKEYCVWMQTAKDHAEDDCLLILKKRGVMNNLLYDQYFAVAQYDELKWVTLDLMSLDEALCEESLSGRATPSKEVMVYLPEDIDFPSEGAELLCKHNGFNTYRWVR